MCRLEDKENCNDERLTFYYINISKSNKDECLLNASLCSKSHYSS
jgi:hypothetical protein